MIFRNIYLKSNSDSEMILKIFVFYLEKKITSIKEITPSILKNVVENIYQVCRGSYSIIVMINNRNIEKAQPVVILWAKNLNDFCLKLLYKPN